jgi:hypothetical protein
MSDLTTEHVVVVVRNQGKIHWFRSDRDLWVMDVNKWRDEFIAHGYNVPEFNDLFRFGIHVVNDESKTKFLTAMSNFEVSRDKLSFELANRYSSAKSWWDVKDLFPIMFIDFDNRKVAGFYPDGARMERYIPDGWLGEFIDFANEYPEDIFPTKEKFWVKGNADLLKLLNERAEGNN